MDSNDKLCLRIYNMDRFIKDNLYQNVVICIKRARQIEFDMFEEINSKLNDWLDYSDQFSETEVNFEVQNKIAQYYEKLEKPENIAIKEFENNEITVVESKNESEFV